MHWKMSIDLRRPAVMSEGNLDPFDGFVTYRLLQEHAPHAPHALTNEIRGASRTGLACHVRSCACVHSC
jgi:hypothetical protein